MDSGLRGRGVSALTAVVCDRLCGNSVCSQGPVCERDAEGARPAPRARGSLDRVPATHPDDTL